MNTATGAERRGGLRPLAGEALLAAWERGSAQRQLARALTLLLAGYADLKEPDVSAMTVPAMVTSCCSAKSTVVMTPLS